MIPYHRKANKELNGGKDFAETLADLENCYFCDPDDNTESLWCDITKFKSLNDIQKTKRVKYDGADNKQFWIKTPN